MGRILIVLDEQRGGSYHLHEEPSPWKGYPDDRTSTVTVMPRKSVEAAKRVAKRDADLAEWFHAGTSLVSMRESRRSWICTWR